MRNVGVRLFFGSSREGDTASDFSIKIPQRPIILDQTKTYPRDFDRSLATSAAAEEPIRSILQLHGGRMKETTFWNATHAVFAVEESTDSGRLTGGSEKVQSAGDSECMG
jgi:hypothetical protein